MKEINHQVSKTSDVQSNCKCTTEDHFKIVSYILSGMPGGTLLGANFGITGALLGGIVGRFVTGFILLNDKNIDSDKLYTMYGGFCVIYISINSLYLMVKSE